MPECLSSPHPGRYKKAVQDSPVDLRVLPPKRWNFNPRPCHPFEEKPLEASILVLHRLLTRHKFAYPRGAIRFRLLHFNDACITTGYRPSDFKPSSLFIFKRDCTF